jgi:outer membrane protein TolC
MKKALSGILVLMLLAAAGTARAQDKLTLKQCIDLALQNSQALQIADESITGAGLKVNESRSQVLPQVNIGGSYTRMTLVQEFAISFGGQTFKAKFGVANNYDFRATAAEQLFTWGRITKSIELSKVGVDLAKDGLDMTKQIVSYQVAPIFYGLIFLREAIKVLDDNIGLFQKKLDIMTQRYKAGLVSSFDTSTLEVQISTLRAQRLDFENTIRKLNIAFNTLAARSADAVLDPQGRVDDAPLPVDKDALLGAAQAQRVEFEQLTHQSRITQLSIDIARAANKPSLILGLNYDFRNGYLPNINQIKGNFMASLTLNFPVFDGFRTSALAAEGESGLRTLDLQRKNLLRSVNLEIETSLSDLRNIEEKIVIEKLKIKQAEDALRIAEDRYQKGFLSATDYVESQNNVNTAKLNHLQLLYNRILGRYNLDRAIGKRIYE